MSLSLQQETKPDGLKVKTYGTLIGDNNTVHLGDYEISLKDFIEASLYVLTNTDLEPNDPRLKFVKIVKSMKEVDGYSVNKKRLSF